MMKEEVSVTTEENTMMIFEEVAKDLMMMGTEEEEAAVEILKGEVEVVTMTEVTTVAETGIDTHREVTMTGQEAPSSEDMEVEENLLLRYAGEICHLHPWEVVEVDHPI